MRRKAAIIGFSSVFAFGAISVAVSVSAAPGKSHGAFWADRMSHTPDCPEADPPATEGELDAGVDATLPPTITDGTEGGTDVVIPPGRLPYNGGVIVSQAKVAAVLWGSNVNQQVQRNIGTFYTALVKGALMHYLSEFATPTQTIGSYGSYLGTFHIHPAVMSGTITDAEVQTELTTQISRGDLPPNDANTIYMIHFPPGITIQGPQATGLSCVDYCGYHFWGSNINYAILPDQSGGCAPGPEGCNLDASATCCGDRSAFDNLTKTASHELIEAITDPQPLAPAWSAILSGGEAADLCNFSRVGDNAYSTIVAQNGTTFQAQRGFSNSAFRAGIGTPRGCVDYPTTLCCDSSLPANASFPPPVACTWRGSGVTACPTDGADMTVSVQSVGGFGSGTMSLSSNPPYDGACFPVDNSGVPSFCATVAPAGGLTARPPATITMPTDPAIPLAEACYGSPVPGFGCPAVAPTLVNGSCCAVPAIPFVDGGATDAGAMQTVQVAMPSVLQPR